MISKGFKKTATTLTPESLGVNTNVAGSRLRGLFGTAPKPPVPPAAPANVSVGGGR